MISKDNAIAIKGGSFDGIICYETPEYGFVSGGTFDRAFDETFCAEGFVLVENADGTYGIAEASLAGEGTEANPYLISSVDDLVLFRNSVNAGETKYSAPGVWVALAADIDLAGKILPYAPRETVSANIAYRLPVPHSFANIFVLNVGWNGVGRIYWNEENTLSQPFYGLLSASLVWERGHFGASLWGKNLLNEKYNTFYFRSIGNDFFAQGKPLHFGVSFHVNL